MRRPSRACGWRGIIEELRGAGLEIRRADAIRFV